MPCCLALFLVTLLASGQVDPTDAPAMRRAAPQEPGRRIWHAILASPGGDLPFRLELDRTDSGLVARVVGASAREELGSVIEADHHLAIDIAHFAARIDADLVDDGRRLVGTWHRRGLDDSDSKFEFHAVAGTAPLFEATKPPHVSVTGRWQVDFAQSGAVGDGAHLRQRSAGGEHEDRPDHRARRRAAAR